MILRQLASGSTARRLGLALGIDAHRTTVCRWGILVNAALLAGSRLFYKTMQASMEALLPESFAAKGTDDRPWRQSLHVVSGDATNTLVWQKTKLHTLRVNSSYLVADVDDSADFSSVVNLMKQ